MNKLHAVVSTLVLLMFSTCLYAWNATGHKLIAEIAWENLDPDVKTIANTLTDKLSAEYPYIKTFIDIASWPDDLHRQKIDYYSHWHYYDTAFSTDGTPLKNLADSDNASWAISKLEPVVSNTHANPYERARALAFLVHIVGDLHQPLHTVSRISAEYPDGDRGGNLFHLHTKKENLHNLWDSGARLYDDSDTDENIKTLANEITAKYPKSYFSAQINVVDPAQWITEGYQTATTFVYQTPEGAEPDAKYISDAQNIVEMKTALAGYRLAALLNQLLK